MVYHHKPSYLQWLIIYSHETERKIYISSGYHVDASHSTKNILKQYAYFYKDKF
jgi:hypothetical protein